MLACNVWVFIARLIYIILDPRAPIELSCDLELCPPFFSVKTARLENARHMDPYTFEAMRLIKRLGVFIKYKNPLLFKFLYFLFVPDKQFMCLILAWNMILVYNIQLFCVNITTTNFFTIPKPLLQAKLT